MAREHGTNVCYTIDGCRCDECRRANREYEHARTVRRIQGRSLFVDTEPVRRRVLELRALGMSDDEIARAAGLNDARLSDLMTGHWRTGRPLTRMKRENAEAIMAVRHRAPRPRTYVEAKDFPTLVLELMAMGYSGRWISCQINLSYQGMRRLLDTRHTAGAYARLVKLHGSTKVCAPVSPQASRAHNFATARLSRRRAA